MKLRAFGLGEGIGAMATIHAGSGFVRKALGVAEGEGLAPGKALDVPEGERLALGTALFL
jgi:hypothetical protein